MIEPVRVNVSKSKHLGLCIIISVARGLNHASKVIVDPRGCLRPGSIPIFQFMVLFRLDSLVLSELIVVVVSCTS